jgi:1,4-dihydroxy-2-naphthoate octaprenyltransferase
MATRPRTLPAALGPVAIGTAAALADDAFAALPAMAALGGALLLQIAVNLANDYFDFRRGIDSEKRLGPVRVTQSGLIPPGHVFGAMWLVLALAAACGTYLAAVGGWPIIVIGLASIAGVIGYSGGPYPLASHGLGDLFVFVFFGPVAVGGTYYVQTLTLSPPVLLWSVSPGLLIAAILVVNNLRDIETDRAAGKYSLAVMIGPHWSRREYALLVTLAYAVPVLMWLVGTAAPTVLLAWVTLPLGIYNMRRLFHESGAALNTRLGATAMLSFWFSLLLAIGIVAA